jgi:DNA-binding FadR family transcriptional regulator
MYALLEALQPIENMIIVRTRERKIIVGQHIQLLRAIRQQDADKAGQLFKAQMVFLRNQLAAAADQREKRRPAGADAAIIQRPKRKPAAKRVRA